ncbi:DUF4136 domain-containing protein [Puia sp.]|uniref:DUF4136 domain-containing protein n=1 Tax=Puia sp. TaxID=2045100 RepID=UPI002F41038C
MNRLRTLLLSGVAAMNLLLGSCKKDPLNNLTNEESRIYITNYDTVANFSAYATFSITDSVAVIQDNQFAGHSYDAYDVNIINAMTQQMTQRGYQLVSKSANPDLAINISRVLSSSTVLFSYADYWDYYGDFYDPYYWGYPGYGYYDPYAVGAYTVNSGGLEIDLLDLKNAAANGNKLVGLWTGLARGEDVFNPSNASAEVAAMFSQSAYLKK